MSQKQSVVERRARGTYRTLAHARCMVGGMTSPVSFRLRLDGKRRPTLPQSLLDAAGVGPGQDLVAHVEGPGRIVLEGAATVLAGLQAAVRAGKTSHGSAGSLAAELLADRLADSSLDR
jgi:bifunctional DNA-binding transcriptional regulator/antitoxin component of YhaV-PrlF toxin-antitoxin module